MFHFTLYLHSLSLWNFGTTVIANLLLRSIHMFYKLDVEISSNEAWPFLFFVGASRLSCKNCYPKKQKIQGENPRYIGAVGLKNRKVMRFSCLYFLSAQQ